MPAYECPTCRKTLRVESREQAPHRPFCSQRCRMIDLGKWFAEEYRISEPLNPSQLTDQTPAPDRED